MYFQKGRKWELPEPSVPGGVDESGEVGLGNGPIVL